MIFMKRIKKIITIFEAVNDENVKNKASQDENLSKLDGRLSFLEKDYNEYRLQSVEEISIQRAVETIIQILYDKGLFDNYATADEVLQDSLFTRRRPDLEEAIDVIQ